MFDKFFAATLTHRLLAAIACWVALLVGTAAAQPLDDPTNPFTLDEPLIPPTPYLSPLGTAYFTTDFVGFSRTSPTEPYAKANRTTVVLSGGDLDYAFQPGMRALLGVRLTDYLAVEASYLGLFDWNEQQSVTNRDPNILGTTGNLSSPFTNFGNPPQAGLDFNNFVSVASETQFNTGELNLRRRVDLPSSGFQAAGIAGLRYLTLADRFAYRSRSASPAPAGAEAAADVNANNRMLGPQLGGALEAHIERRAWFNFETKAMMLSNDSSQGSAYTSPAAAAAGERSQRRISFGVDVQATLSWRFTPGIVGRVGYQAIFLEGVSLGSENFENLALNPGVDPAILLVNDGNITFHGPFTGLTMTW